MKLCNPKKSAESVFPLIFTGKPRRWGFFCQLQSPFGLYLGLGFIRFRWGSA